LARKKEGKEEGSIHNFMESFLNELTLMNPKAKERGASAPSHPIWIPPSENWAKVNVDAGVARNGENGVVAAVARSAAGDYLGGSAVLIAGIANPEVLEALASSPGGTKPGARSSPSESTSG
jgi:hypothetical protein